MSCLLCKGTELRATTEECICSRCFLQMASMNRDQIVGVRNRSHAEGHVVGFERFDRFLNRFDKSEVTRRKSQQERKPKIRLSKVERDYIDSAVRKRL